MTNEQEYVEYFNEELKCRRKLAIVEKKYFSDEEKIKYKVLMGKTISFSEEFLRAEQLFESDVVIVRKGTVEEEFIIGLDKNLNNDEIKISKKYIEFLKAGEVIKPKLFNFTKVEIQDIEKIRDGIVVFPKKYKTIFEKIDHTNIEIFNRFTGATIEINKDKAHYSDSLAEKSIKLNRAQRNILECEHPKKILKFNYMCMEETLKRKMDREENEKEKEKLKKYKENIQVYKNEKALTIEAIKENLKSKDGRYAFLLGIKNALEESGYLNIGIRLINTNMKKKSLFFKFREFLAQKIIGSNNISLKVIRPYETDEALNVVRLTKSTIDLLGLEETDNIIIHYRGEMAKARVLVLEDLEAIKETNIIQSEGELNLCIGMPTVIRNKLKIRSIDMSCRVERDKGYLFKKNLNLQFISIVATILTVKQTFSNNLIALILICIIIPIAIYIIFSEVRNKING